MADLKVSPVADADLSDLRERVRRIEARLDLIERHGQPAPPAADAPRATVAAPLRDSESAAATAFTRIAMLSFALLGALILRELTRNGLLGARLGTVLGCAYACHLIALSLLPGRLGRLARATSLFQCCGVLLAYTIALEGALRSLTWGRPAAMGMLLGFAALAVVTSVIHNKVTLAATTLVAGVCGLAALGLDASGLTLQLGGMLLLAGAATALARKARWAHLQFLVAPLMMALLAIGLAITRRQAISGQVVLATGLAYWLVLAVNHFAGMRRLGASAMWLPAATLWLAGLALAEQWPHRAGASVAVAAAAVAAAGIVARLAPENRAGLAGLLMTAAASGILGWGSLDPHGLLAAVAGVALAAAGASAPAWAATGATLLLIRAAAAAGLDLAPTSALAVLASLGVASILLLYYHRAGLPTDGARPEIARWLDVLVLYVGMAVMLRGCLAGVQELLSDPDSRQIAATGLFAASAVAWTWWGHASRRRAVLYGGMLCMALAVAKVAVIDLARLHGLRLLASVVLLGCSSIAVSAILRSRSRRSADH